MLDYAELPLPDRNRIHGSPQDPKDLRIRFNRRRYNWLRPLGFAKLLMYLSRTNLASRPDHVADGR